MNTKSLQQHWQEVYQKQQGHEHASWYQESPELVFSWLSALPDLRTSGIIDIGGGDSLFVDRALDLGFRDVTVLDISEQALNKAKTRLGEHQGAVTWICSNITGYTPKRKYSLWHDRAAFHFLHTETEREGYKNALLQGLEPDGFIILATFSKNGPDKCSGLPVRQYSLEELKSFLGDEFELLRHEYYNHNTPGGASQNFIYTLFQRILS